MTDVFLRLFVIVFAVLLLGVALEVYVREAKQTIHSLFSRYGDQDKTRGGSSGR